jgi:hypothetical protein
MDYFNPATLVYEFYEKMNTRRERSQSHHPSGLCAEDSKGNFIGVCRRKLWYEMSGYEVTDEIEGINLFKMDFGNLLHERMDGIVDDALMLFHQDEHEIIGDEIRFEWKDRGLALPFHGRIDKMVVFRGKTLGSEWKSIYGRGMDYVIKDGPKEDALLQCIAYLNQKKHPLDGIVLTYIARDSGYIYSFFLWYEGKGSGRKLRMKWLNSDAESIIPWDMKDIRRALKKVEDHLDVKTPPERDYNALAKGGQLIKNIGKQKSDWRCLYCPFAQTSWAEEIEVSKE